MEIAIIILCVGLALSLQSVAVTVRHLFNLLYTVSVTRLLFNPCIMHQTHRQLSSPEWQDVIMHLKCCVITMIVGYWDLYCTSSDIPLTITFTFAFTRSACFCTLHARPPRIKDYYILNEIRLKLTLAWVSFEVLTSLNNLEKHTQMGLWFAS